MSRPRDFDETAVLDAAIDCFWTNGYAATSVRDLGDAMGLGSASFYNAFGDKNTLFGRCLDRYLALNMRERFERLIGSMGPRAAVETFLAQTVAESIADPRGCLLVNTVLELSPEESEMGSVVAARLHEIEDFFHGRIEAGQRDGTISRDRSAADLARVMLTTVIGIRVLARTRPEPALLDGTSKHVLTLLDA